MRSIFSYLIAIAAVTGATFLNGFIDPQARFEDPFFIYFSAVVVAGWIGGLGPALLATVCSVGGAAMLMGWGGPSDAFDDPRLVVKLVMFLFDGAMIALLCAALRYAWSQARRANAKLEVVLEDMPVAIFSFDTDGIITFLRGAGSILPEKKDRDLVGRSIFEVGEASDEGRLAVKRALGGEEFTSTFLIDGIWVECHYSPVKSAEGRILGVNGVALNVTERFSAEAARATSEALFRRVFESNMIGLLVNDMDGQVFEANDAFLAMVGYTREDFIKDRLQWKGLTPPEFSAMNQEAMQRVRETGSCSPFEKQLFHKDGHRVDVLMGVGLTESHQGSRCITYVLDISDRKRAERALLEANRDLDQRVRERSGELYNTYSFLDSLVENIPNMIFVKDAEDLRFLRLNRAGEQLLGLKREDVIGKKDSDFFPPEQTAEFNARDRHAINSGTLLDVHEEEILTADRGMRLLHTKKIPLRDETGRPRYLLGISEDITARKAAESERIEMLRAQSDREAVEKSAARIEFLSDASAVLGSSLDDQVTLANVARLAVSRIADWCAVYMINSNGEIEQRAVTHADPSMTATVDELEKRYPIDVKDARGGAEVVRTGRPQLVTLYDEDSLRSMARDSAHLELLHHVGLRSSICVPLKARGTIVGMMRFVTTEFSNRRFTIEDLHLAEDLAARAGLAIDNARLYRASQEANRVKDDFLATVSHELRTPLNVIQGYSEMILADDAQMSSSERAEALRAIHRSAANQTRIIGDLLDISAVMSGKIPFKPDEVDPTEIVGGVIENMLPTAESKDVRIEPDFSRAPKTIRSDAVRLQQITWNLISNALKFTPPGGRISVRGLTRDAVFVLEVEDDGVGFEPEFAPHLFERFRQEDSSTTRKYGGLGLGLAIVRQLAELHGGSVEGVSAGRGKGARFTVTFPLPKAMRPSKTPKEAARALPRFDGMKVLLVEDSVDNRFLIEMILKQAGAKVWSADSPPAAREILDHERPDAIISDIGMPGEDGISFVRWLRAREHQGVSHIPAIALTAYVRPEEKSQALAAGFEAHVAKPATRDVLLRTLAEVTETATAH